MHWWNTDDHIVLNSYLIYQKVYQKPIYLSKEQCSPEKRTLSLAPLICKTSHRRRPSWRLAQGSLASSHYVYQWSEKGVRGNTRWFCSLFFLSLCVHISLLWIWWVKPYKPHVQVGESEMRLTLEDKGKREIESRKFTPPLSPLVSKSVSSMGRDPYSSSS